MNSSFMLSPLMVDEATEPRLKSSTNELIYEKEKYTKFKSITSDDLREPRIIDSDFQTVKIQFRAIGLIEKATRKEVLKIRRLIGL